MHDALRQLVACQTGVGHSVEPDIRRVLERAFDTDLAAVRIHNGKVAGRLAAEFGVDAFAYGTDIYFAPGRYRPARQKGLWLLAHEVAHVLQQAAGQTPAHGAGEPSGYAVLERAANQAADQVLSGQPVSPALRAIALVEAVHAGRRPALQFHKSFEHRVLGDLSRTELQEISSGGPERTRILEREIALQRLWQKDPEAVTEEEITSQCPGISTLRLRESGLIVTYGELNALPDYLTTGAVADSIPTAVLLPILQFLRQEANVSLNRLLNREDQTPFEHAVYTPSPTASSLSNLIMSSKAADDLTRGLGLYGTDHYKAVLLRNACHFAPFSWYRWKQSYAMAITLARQAHTARDADERAYLTSAAWLQHGYADHFLHDSFAAGHLVNKTLIMQWYVEWVGGQKFAPVFNWQTIKNMTSKAQPGLAGRRLYDRDYAGLSNDPQTSEEQGFYGIRLANTGLVAGDSDDVDAAYQDYFAFLSSLIVSASSAAMTDYHNEHSLWVASEQHPEPYQIWGDDTLLSGGGGEAGVVATSEAAAMSRLSLCQALTTGDTEIGLSDILDRFPAKVRVAGGQLLELEAFNDTQRQFCIDEIFPDLWRKTPALKALKPNFAHNLSVDQDLAVRWSADLDNARSTTASVLPVGNRLYVGSNGYLYQIDALTGKVLTSLLLTGAAGKAGNYETRLTTDGEMVFAGVHGSVYAVQVSGAFHLAWSAVLPGAGGAAVDPLIDNHRLFAGSNGYTCQINPQNGSVISSVRLGSVLGQGDYTMRLAVAGSTLIAGGHGYLYGVTLADLAKSWELRLPDSGYKQVEVLVSHGQLFAGSAGRAYQVDPISGKLLRMLRVTDALGVGDYPTTLAVDQRTLFVGTHGHVYAISCADWSKPAWTADLAGDRHTVANLIAGGGQLLAGSYGHVFRIDPTSGAVLRSMMVTLGYGFGDYETRLAFNSTMDEIFVGVHGCSHKLATVHASATWSAYDRCPGGQRS